MGDTVFIADADPRWPEMYAQEEARILAALPTGLVTRLEHVGIPGRLFFEKRADGTVRTHHLHIAEPGGKSWTENLLFRDYLRSHPDEARLYEYLKKDMARRHRFQRAAYTASKTDYMLSVLEKARTEQEEQQCPETQTSKK